jgi:hypothetical protein
MRSTVEDHVTGLQSLDLLADRDVRESVAECLPLHRTTAPASTQAGGESTCRRLSSIGVHVFSDDPFDPQGREKRGNERQREWEGRRD